MNEPLHPLTVTEILDRTAQMYRSRFLVFLGVATIPAATMFVFLAGIFGAFSWIGTVVRHGNAPMMSARILVFVLLIVAVPANLGASALGEAAMTDAAARFFLGHAITIRGAYKTAWQHGWRYVGLYVLQGLAIAVGPLLVFGAVVAMMIISKVSGYATNDPSPVFGGMLFLAAAVVGVFALVMLLRLCLAFAVSVVEQASAWTALKRGASLSAGTRWRILLIYVLGWFLNQILTWILAFPAVIVLALIPSLQGPAHAQLLGEIMIFLFYGAMFAVRALTKPVYGIALTLFYFDARIRKEGFDIEWMMQQAGLVYTPAPEITPVPQAAAVSAEEIAPAALSLEAAAETAIAAGEGGLTTVPAEEKG